MPPIDFLVMPLAVVCSAFMPCPVRPKLSQVPVHLSLYDASGDGALIEFNGEKVTRGTAGTAASLSLSL